MIGLAILLQAQALAGAPTVGDTIWLTRTVQATPGQVVRPREWEPADPVESAGQPRVTVLGTTVELSYPVTVWRAGQHRIEIPGPLVLGPNGAADSLPPYVATLTVRSVLPVVPADSSLAPQPRAAFVPRWTMSPVATIALWVLALVILLPLRWWWWRRGLPMPQPAADPGPPDVPVERWAHAGERRAVASLGAIQLRTVLAGRESGGEAGTRTEAQAGADAADNELRELLDALDRARFGSTTGEDALALFRRATQVARQLVRDPT